MVQFVDIDPEQLMGHREGRRGRVSYPILKSFMETKKKAAMLDRTGMQQSLVSLNSCLNSYIKSHRLPVRVVQRSNQIYLLRRDLDENGEFDPNWKWDDEEIATEGRPGIESHVAPVPLNAAEVKSRAAIEKKKVTK